MRRALSWARPLLLVVLACCSPRQPSARVEPQPSTSATPADPREQRLASAVLALLEHEHLQRRTIDDRVSMAAFDEYVDALDPGKTFLLASDRAELQDKATLIDDELHAGRLDLAHQGAEIFARRLAVVDKLVADLLAKPFDSSNEEFVETDADKLQLAATEAELRERWRTRLELEVLERVALMEDTLAARARGDKPKDKGNEGARLGTPVDVSGDSVVGPIPATPEEREAKARADLAKSYSARFHRLASPGPLDAAATLVNAVTGVFDPHTNYLPPDDKANFDIQLSGSLEGIGAVLREDDHYIRVVEVVPGGASWRQGQLETGDLILSVAQGGKAPVDVTDMRIDDVVRMIRGPKGTVVTLTVQKPTDEVKVISITRDVVVIEEAYARGATLQPKGGGRRPFGYIHLPSFYGGQRSSSRSAATDMRRLLGEMQKRKLAGVIIDLRSNGGGLLGDAVEMTGLLIDRGPVVQTKNNDGGHDVLGDEQGGTAFDGPVVVMVDRFSASASEIVAGALQDYHRAVIVGTGPTHGKGTVQMLAGLDGDGGGAQLGVLKLTVQQFYRVSGLSTQWQGVTPDIVLPDPAGFLETGERHLENSIKSSQIEPVSHQDWPVTWKVADLAARSAKRVAKHDVFSKIAARTQLLLVRRDQTKLPLAKTAWLTLRKEQRAALDAVSPDLDKSPPRFGVTPLEYAGKAPVAARPGGRADDRATRWRDALARDPWVEEALLVLADAAAPPH